MIALPHRLRLVAVLSAIIVVAEVCALSRVAVAQPGPARPEPTANELERAKKLFDEAEANKRAADALAKRRRVARARAAYAKAADGYRAAFTLTGATELLYNVAQMRRLSGAMDRALASYCEYVRLDPNGGRAKRSRSYIDEVGPKAGGRPAARAGSAEQRWCPRQPTRGGGDGSGASAGAIEPGGGAAGDATTAGDAGAGDAGVGVPGAAGSAGGLGGNGPGAGVTERRDPSRPGGVYRLGFWAAAGTTALLATIAVVTGVQTRGLESDAEVAGAAAGLEGDPCTAAEAQDLADIVDVCERGRGRAKLTNAALGATVAVAAVTGFLFYKGYLGAPERGTRAAWVAPAVTADAALVTAGLRF